MRAAWAVSPPSGLTHVCVIKPPGGEHGGDVIARPELEPVENSRERLAERRNCVFDRNWRRRLDGSGDQPVALHLFQRLRQHLLRHALNVAPQSVETAGSIA